LSWITLQFRDELIFKFLEGVGLETREIPGRYQGKKILSGKTYLLTSRLELQWSLVVDRAVLYVTYFMYFSADYVIINIFAEYALTFTVYGYCYCICLTAFFPRQPG